MRTIILGAACALATSCVSTRADAQEGASTERGFGERGSMLFSVENVFGYLTQSYTQNQGNGVTEFTHSGAFPAGLVGTRFAIHGLAPSGLTYGGILGFTYASGTGSNSSDLTMVSLGPRIGYALALPKAKQIGFWGRVGPSFQYAHAGSSRPSSTSSDLWALDLSFEVFLVWTPVEHFGLLAGPSFDIGLAGDESQGNSDVGLKYKSSGVNVGLVWDF